MRIRAPKDFWSGVMFCAFAAVAILAARGYSLGSAGKMGPGYFPLLLGGLLGVLGVILIGRSLVLDGEPVPRFHLVPLALIAVAGAGRCSRRSRPIRSRRTSPGRRAPSAAATSAAWRRRNPPTMPARRRRSSRC